MEAGKKNYLLSKLGLILEILRLMIIYFSYWLKRICLVSKVCILVIKMILSESKTIRQGHSCFDEKLTTQATLVIFM
jgi:hypothetical protein